MFQPPLDWQGVWVAAAECTCEKPVGARGMNGAESLVATAIAAGIEVCFANPGTTEMPIVAALDARPGVRSVLALFEGVCTGAADGYARMSRRPALTLLHLGPGFANGIANLHNARRAYSPIVNLVGDNPSWHLSADPPLTMDTVSLAQSVSAWVRRSENPRQVATDIVEAVQASLTPPGAVATLILPGDCSWGPSEGVVAPDPAPVRHFVQEDSIEKAAAALKGSRSLLLLGNRALTRRGLRAAARVAEATSCQVMIETFVARLERGAGLPAFDQIPYFPEDALRALNGFNWAVLAGTRAPVSFFGYQGLPGELLPRDCQKVQLAHPGEDVEGALEALASRVGARRNAIVVGRVPPTHPSGPLTVETLIQAIAACQPEGSIVVYEALTSGIGYHQLAAGSPPHSFMTVTGGAIGQGLPCAVGAAIACPDRKVIAFQADGSALYTSQALWTMAREGLDVTVVLCANRVYKILRLELERAGVSDLQGTASALTDLSRPVIDWVAIANGMGVPAVRVETADALVKALDTSLAEDGPSLIEAIL